MFPNTRRSFTRISDEMLRLTWAAFALALVITGALMFAANAHTYFENTAFRLKMLALLGAGVNMAIFQRITFRTVGRLGSGRRPRSRRAWRARASILIWVTVIFLARWIGFTKGYDFEVPENVNFEF